MEKKLYAAHENVPLRGVLDTIPTYRPGKGNGSSVTKLSSNENPFSLAENIQEIIAEVSKNSNRYPDSLSVDLKNDLATLHGIDAECISVGNGSVSLISSLLLALAEAGDEVVMPWRSFEAYPICVGLTGAASVQVPLTEGYAHDFDALARSITDRTRVILLCTPNNPTGVSWREPQFREFMRHVPTDIAVLIDEAYREFDDENSCLDTAKILRDYPNVVVARTFSKAYGLAGLRCGYMMAAPELTRAIVKATMPFSVNIVAQAAARGVLAHRDVMMKQVADIVAERLRVEDELGKRGWDIYPSHANFVWLGGEKAAGISDVCARHNVTVRPFPEGVRVSIGTREENDRFLAALDDYER